MTTQKEVSVHKVKYSRSQGKKIQFLRDIPSDLEINIDDLHKFTSIHSFDRQVGLSSNKLPSKDGIHNRYATTQHDEWQWSRMNLTLQPYHYANGQLNLRCIAQIPGIFKATTEIQLNAWEPIPER
ncbi:hypothetical protein PV326_004396, partial [Microctonus aethiopoides]